MAPGLGRLQIIPFLAAAAANNNSNKKAMDFFKRDHVIIDATKIRALARAGDTPPEGFMPPKAWAVIVQYYQCLSGAANNYVYSHN